MVSKADSRSSGKSTGGTRHEPLVTQVVEQGLERLPEPVDVEEDDRARVSRGVPPSSPSYASSRLPIPGEDEDGVAQLRERGASARRGSRRSRPRCPAPAVPSRPQDGGRDAEDPGRGFDGGAGQHAHEADVRATKTIACLARRIRDRRVRDVGAAGLDRSWIRRRPPRRRMGQCRSQELLVRVVRRLHCM